MSLQDIIENKKVQISIIIFILAIASIKSFKKENKEIDLKKENNFTIGQIVDHKVYGLSETYYIKFSYSVNGVEYMNSVNNSWKFTDCYKTRKCIGRKFIVYYDKKNPENSFMDFDKEK